MPVQGVYTSRHASPCEKMVSGQQKYISHQVQPQPVWRRTRKLCCPLTLGSDEHGHLQQARQGSPQYKTRLHHTCVVDVPERNADDFVDDDDLILTAPVLEQHSLPIEYSLEGLATLSQTTKDTLFVSDRALELSTCIWYIFKWMWDRNNHPYMASIVESPGVVSTTQGDDATTNYTINHIEVSESHHTLGIYLNPRWPYAHFLPYKSGHQCLCDVQNILHACPALPPPH
jgi:hypothetical protein